jgi:GT2 family glycosyltransferase
MPQDHRDVGDATPVAVVVCCRDRPGLLESTVAAVAASLRPVDELCVVDSASADDGVRRVGEAAGAIVVRCELPGASRARNAGVAATRAPIVAFTDDDCVPAPGWAAAMAAAFAARPEVGFVTGQVRPDVEDGSPLSVIVDTEPRRFTHPVDPAPMGHGANMAVRRAAFEAVGGFDEVLGAGGRLRASEEKDLFWRLLRAGWEGRYDPEPVVTHRQWRSRRAALVTELRYGVGGGAFAAKVARLDGGAGRRMLLDRLWAHGVAQAWRDLRNGFEAGAAADLARAAGTLAGAARGWRTPLDGDRFAH